MAVIRISCYFLFFLLLSCQRQHKQAESFDNTRDTVSNDLLDSLGELAYGNYDAFKQQPNLFIQRIENKVLTAEQRDTYVWILINMAYAFQEHSRFLTSTNFYEKALLEDNTHQILSADDRLTYIYKPLANNYTILADYEKSEVLQRDALQEAHDPETKASFLNNLALLYIYKGAHEQAKVAALAGLKSTSTKSLQLLLHNALSTVYMQTGKLDSATIHNTIALQIAQQSKDETLLPGRISATQQSAQLLLAKGEPQEAKKIVLEGITLANQYYPKKRFREKADLYNVLGESYLALQKPLQAALYLKMAKKQLENIDSTQRTSSYTPIQVFKNLGICYLKQNLDSALFYFTEAIERDFAFQQNITSKTSHLWGNSWNRQLLEDVLHWISAADSLTQNQQLSLLWLTELTKGRLLWNDINRSRAWENDSTEMSKAAAQLQRLYTVRDNLTDDSEIKLINKAIDSTLRTFALEERYFTKKVKLPDFKRFKKQLQKGDQVIYSYFVHADSSLSIFQVKKGQINYFHLAERNLLDSIAHFKETYFDKSPNAYNQDPSRYFSQATSLREDLLPQLPKHGTTLQLSLDNELYTLPFDALSLQHDFLIRFFDIQYINSLLMYDLYDTTTYNQQQISILSRDQYDPPLVNLTFVKKEVKNLRDHYASVHYDDRTLNPELLARALQAESIIHIAAHTLIDENQEAKIRLHQSISADQLRYYSIHAPLVVLSACNTASGTILPSEGLESINRAFLSKGIPGVIATQWFANDDAMLDLTAKFYEQLQALKSPVGALANAKRDYLDKQDELGKNPWYWANMVYTGIDTKIDLHKNTDLSYWLYVWLAFLVVTLVVLWFAKSKNKAYETNQKFKK
ncbi:CHAT domain-containing protein [Sphingobacterium sp. LRF_L2]|uniref:CHAT domain-containing protein n=1 Tax=Sphingobacterium sp. LRF_L2 TaxID=3369421 RepID=UPI003F619773